MAKLKNEEDLQRKRKVPRNDAALKFIISKMSQGMTVSEIYSKFPDQCPNPASVHRKAAEDEKWIAGLDKGHTLRYYKILDEMDYLSKGVASEHYPNADFREAEAALKRRIDALKFELAKMAPVLSKRFDRAQKIELEGDGIAPVQVINYYAQPAAIAKGIQINQDADSYDESSSDDDDL
jgi:hypothetical protein